MGMSNQRCRQANRSNSTFSRLRTATQMIKGPLPHNCASLSEAIDKLAATPKGRPLAEILKTVHKEIDGGKVYVSPDLRRAILHAPGGGLVSVRVTVARQAYAGGPWLFRFKSPVNPTK